MQNEYAVGDAQTMHDCAHAVCNCVIPSDRLFCSSYCERAPDSDYLHCECGHENCGEQIPVEESPRRAI